MPARRSPFERVYSVVVAVKGLDGAIELIAGAALLVAPGAVAQLLAGFASELAEGNSALRQTLARSVFAAGSGVASGAGVVALFLLVHGVVKLLTVTALLRRAVHWYPWAIGALAVLLAVQLVDVVIAPGVGGLLLVLLDVVVLALVLWEFDRLRRGTERGAARDGAPSGRAPVG